MSGQNGAGQVIEAGTACRTLVPLTGPLRVIMPSRATVAPLQYLLIPTF
jgi:hypothetical protein